MKKKKSPKKVVKKPSKVPAKPSVLAKSLMPAPMMPPGIGMEETMPMPRIRGRGKMK